jgi:HPt (histidine-containing phosphotransfer) domain-containing protein
VPQLDVPWPEIDGIDSATARDRWCYDLKLFSEMLERLLDESADVAIPAAAQDPGVRDDYIRDIHKLRGGACMLGATVIVELAGKVEAACVSGNMKRAGTLAGRLGLELRRVRVSAERVFIAARAEAGDGASCAAVELGPHLLVELDALLRQQNPTALDRFRDIGPQLKYCMGSASYGVMCRHLDHLEFEDAANELMKGAPAHGKENQARPVPMPIASEAVRR